MAKIQRFNPNKFLNEKGSSSKVIGFEYKSRVKYIGCIFEVYWLKTVDRDIDPVNTPYDGPNGFGGKMPCEAVNPKLISREDIHE